jgi:DNA adenine methylase
MSPNACQPFVKWVGGKRSLLSEILSRLPETFDRYFEPFAGGGAVYFALAPRLSQATLLDRNMELVLAYQAIKKTPGALLARLKDHATRHSKGYYYRIRKQRPIAPIEIAARFIYPNKTCFNGLYRVNKSGGFNAPMGSYARPNIYQHDNILACNRVLKNALIRCGDFEDVEPEIQKGDFIYLDPPYHPTSDASFTKYTKENFTEADQVRLRDFVVRLHRKGAFVMLSNSKTKFIKDLYASDKFFAHTVMAPRTVNCKPLQRDRVEELLITNYPTHHGRGRSDRSRKGADSKNQPWSPRELHWQLIGGVRA